ncbi:MAG: universal stress protein [Thermoplasmata archaeon]|nr:universal stress protein [Thermoplasmata archaeon]
MGEVIVAYDGNEGSVKALNKAVSILRDEDRLVVVYVVPTETPSSEFADIDPNLSREKAQGIIDDALDELRSRGIEAKGIVREGNVADEIIKVGSEHECDMIVVGSKGLIKIGAFALGSVADKVARDANRPVLIVR